jgi:hypothetical protein
VAAHEILGDLVRDALIAEGCNEVIEQGRRIPAADSFPKVLPRRPETGFIDEGGGAGDVADLQDQPGRMGEGRISSPGERPKPYTLISASDMVVKSSRRACAARRYRSTISLLRSGFRVAEAKTRRSSICRS